MDNFKRYIILWLSQSVSQLGSMMTAFALNLWVFDQTHSALSLSLMSFCNYVPFILASLFVGSFVDNHNKKKIMLISDSVAALGTLAVMVLFIAGILAVWHIYIVNLIVGLSTAFQQPASSVAIGKIVPKNKISNVSGMNSFSSNLIMVFNPMLAAALFSIGGLAVVLIIDFSSFILAFLVLLILIHIPEDREKKKQSFMFEGFVEGFRFLKKERGLLYIMMTMALINFFSRLTYENILSPMILFRSGDNKTVLGIVQACMGIGGIVGGIFVSFMKEIKNKASMIYLSATLSFLCGDILMAIGQNALLWSIAGIAASLPIPFIMAGQNTVMYRRVPEVMQGRVFAVRNAIQYSTIPIGIILGGYLADYVFEPFIKSNLVLSDQLKLFVGKGDGSGMALMFLITGISGASISIHSYFNKEIRKLND